MHPITWLFPVCMRENLEKCGIFGRSLEEIRVRVNQYLMFVTADGEFFLSGNALREKPDANSVKMYADDIMQMCNFMSRYSLYACEEDLRRGFLTVEGGHRVGICGQVSVEHGRIRRISPISYLNIRIASEHKGCATGMLPFLHENSRFLNTLILSPPGAGKTTLLRDLVRQLSDGNRDFQGKKVGLVDERSEIAGAIRGVPQNDVGLRTDVLDGCPKAEGMMLLVRSMSPEIIAVDELGGTADLSALYASVSCGCGILATVHCDCTEKLWTKPGWEICRQQEFFARFIELENADGTRNWRVFDARGREFGSGQLKGVEMC